MEVNMFGPLVSAVIGAAFGAGAAVITFKEKLSIAARDQAHAAEMAELKSTQVDTRMAGYERRQLVMLSLLVDIARKMNVEHRFTDFLPGPDHTK